MEVLRTVVKRQVKDLQIGKAGRVWNQKQSKRKTCRAEEKGGRAKRAANNGTRCRDGVHHSKKTA